MIKSKSGFTVAELLIVLVVLVILVVVVVVTYKGVTSRANDAAVMSDLDNYAGAIEAFKLSNGRYPQTVAELNALPISVSKGAYRPSPYLWSVKYCYNATDYAIGGESKSGNGFYSSTLYANGTITKRPGAQSTEWCRDDYGFKDGSGNATNTYSAWHDANFPWKGGTQDATGGSSNN